MERIHSLPQPALPVFSRAQARPRARRLALAVTLGGVLAVACLGLYARTLAPGLLWGDGGEWQAVVPSAGVPHPTGYPTYLLLGQLVLAITRLATVVGLPAVSPALALNGLSALAAVAAVLLVFLYLLRTGCRPLVAASAAGILATGEPFWRESLGAEVYTLHLALLAAAVLAFAAYLRAPSRQAASIFFGIYALGLGHHLLLAILAPAFLLTWLASRPSRREAQDLLPVAALAAVAVAALYAIIPWRSHGNPLLDWGNPETASALWSYVTGSYFKSRMFGVAWADLPARLARLGSDFAHQIPMPAWPFVALGALAPGRSHGRQAQVRLSRLLVAINLVYAAGYDIYDIEPYFLPSFMLAAVWFGWGLDRVLSWLLATPGGRRSASRTPGLRPAAAAAVLCAALALPALAATANLPHVDQSRDRAAESWARSVLAALPADARLLSNWRTSCPLWYLQVVEGARPDVTILNRDPLTWPAEVRRVGGAGRLYLAEDSVDVAAGHRLRRAGPVWRVLFRPSDPHRAGRRRRSSFQIAGGGSG